MLGLRPPRASPCSQGIASSANNGSVLRYGFVVIGGYWVYFVEWIPNNFKYFWVLSLPGGVAWPIMLAYCIDKYFACLFLAAVFLVVRPFLRALGIDMYVACFFLAVLPSR